MSWKEPLEADARLAAQNAVKIRAALKQSVNSKTMFEAYQATQPQSTGNLAQARARARAWAIINVRVNMETLKLILLQVWATGFLLGDLAAAEQITEATRANRRKSAEINKAEAQVASEIDWATWKPGDRVSALLLKPPRAFQRLLEQQGVTIKEITNTTLRDIGNAIGEAVELGLSAKQAANLINRSLANPARSLMIAITESNRAMSAATAARYQQAGLEQMEWTTFDPCDICARNDGTIVQIGAPFPSGHTKPPAHPHCRCALLPVIPGFDGSPQMPEGIETNPMSPRIETPAQDRPLTKEELHQRMSWQRREGFTTSSVSEDQIFALESYTKNSYLNMQDKARKYPAGAPLSKDPFIARLQKANDDLSALIQAAPPLPREIVTYRGLQGSVVDSFVTLQPGDVIENKAFSSTSHLREKAEIYAYGNGEKGIVLEVISPAGTKGVNVEAFFEELDLGDAMFGPDGVESRVQFEWLLDRNSDFVVVSNDGKTLRVKVRQNG